jgi:hypothetical protein
MTIISIDLLTATVSESSHSNGWSGRLISRNRTHVFRRHHKFGYGRVVKDPKVSAFLGKEFSYRLVGVNHCFVGY